MPQKIFDKKNVMVTGGAGFIGSHLCDRLIHDSNVICVDNFISGDESNIDHLLSNQDFEFIRHDVGDPMNLEDFPELEKFHIKFQGVQEIYHLACPHIVKDFLKHTVAVITANSQGVKNMLDLAVKHKAKFIHASSSVVYGARVSDDFYFTEDYQGMVDFTGPRSCYDEGKRFAETIIVNYKNKYNMPFKVARIFRTYGPRMKLNDGQMIPDFIENALDGKELLIFGDKNFRTSLCYVSDIVDGMIKLMALEKDIPPINLGSDYDFKLKDVANQIIQMTSSDSKVSFKDPLVFMTPLGLPDTGLAKETLSWVPLVTLEKGLKDTIDYAKASRSLVGLERISEVSEELNNSEESQEDNKKT